MKNNSSNQLGYTLIELLAVIALIAIIILLTTPAIREVKNRVIEGSLRSSASGLIRSAKIYYEKYMSENYVDPETTSNLTYNEFQINNGKILDSQGHTLSYEGKLPQTGFVRIYQDGSISIKIVNNKFVACKSNTEDKIISGKKEEKCK
jgi:prepilin-type N-terminal cleavage/methylation domain-containing protein